MRVPNHRYYLGEPPPQLLYDGAVSGDVQRVEVRLRPLRVISGATSTLTEHFHIGAALGSKHKQKQGEVAYPKLEGRLT